MRPILLKGHERPLTAICYNREGDLLFTCAKDTHPTAWWSNNGERLGTYVGHTGACYSICVNASTDLLLTGSADNSARIWDVRSGEEKAKWMFRAPVRCLDFAHGDSHWLAGTDNIMGATPAVHIFRLNKSDPEEEDEPVSVLVGHNAKVTGAQWGPLNDWIISTSGDGCIKKWDVQTGEEMISVEGDKGHAKSINSLYFSPDFTHFITGSSDCSAKLWDTKTLECIKTYKTERPVNAAAISPLNDHVIVGGGQEASMVTTTSSRVGHFQVKFFHKIYEDELANCKGHFGPVNCLAYNPTGLSFASGGEDGFVRVHDFDKEYFTINPYM